ncbi:MAG TPA: flagellar protein FlaG [Noviherbaspirillum sp.]|nr:flagellar protein FlaG [Noviherbaspirillum sp.]
MLISPLGSGGLPGTTISTPPQSSPEQSTAPNPTIKTSASVELPSRAVRSVSTPTTEQIKDALDQLNKALKTMSNGVQFALDDETQIRIAKLVDTQTNEVIRQFPAQELIDLAKALDKLHGSLIQQKA